MTEIDVVRADPDAPHFGDDPLATGLDPDMVVPALIRRWARAEPDRPFLFEVGGRSATYGEAFDELGRWSTVLRSMGIGPGDRIASFLPASIDAQMLWLAASCVGAYEVAVNPELRGQLLDHVLRDSGAGHCFARPDNIEVPRNSSVDIPITVVARDGSFTAGVVADPLDVLPGPADVCCVIYTSGTTGPAKGAVIPWGQFSAIVGRTPRSWLSGDDAVYAPLPMFHVTGRTPMISMSEVGGRVILREKVSISEYWSDIEEFGCTSTTLSSMALLLMAAPARADDAMNPVRLGLVGAIGPSSVAFAKRFGLKLMANYGSTEIGFPFAHRDVTAESCHLAGWLRPGYAAKTIGPDGEILPRGAVGELCIKPPHPLLMMQGYLGQPEMTATVMIDGWYHTGDAAILHDDGALQYVDRMRDTLRRFGENISSTAVESQVGVDPEVIECAVMGVPSEVAGQEVLLIVRPMDGVSFDREALYVRLSDVLPRHCLPAYIVTRTDEFPKTPNGKIRKIELRASLDELMASAWVSPSATSRHQKAGL